MRLFTAIEVPKPIKEKILSKSSELNVPGISCVSEESLHITLHFFGEKSETEKDKIVSLLNNVKWFPFKINVSGISTFNPKFLRVIFVGISEGKGKLISLFEKLSVELENEGISFEKEKYVPHITIARVKHADKHSLFYFMEKNKDYEFGSFEMNRFYLIKSTLTSNGPLYEKLFEFKRDGAF
ncbi:MAG: RNA 2',3'-cyclic phosphodiesterase [Candidatus Micrarchaeia archaeon]